jgi:hypothetical protein
MYWLGWKGLTVARMRADLARLLQLPSASRLAAAAAPGAAFPSGPADRAGSSTTSGTTASSAFPSGPGDRAGGGVGP